MNKALIESNPVCLATITDGHKPNQVIAAYAKCLENKIVITDNYMTRTIRDIEKNPSICLAVYDENWNGVKIIGNAEYFTAGPWIEFIKQIPENNEMPCKGAIVINIEKEIKLH